MRAPLTLKLYRYTASPSHPKTRYMKPGTSHPKPIYIHTIQRAPLTLKLRKLLRHDKRIHGYVGSCFDNGSGLILVTIPSALCSRYLIEAIVVNYFFCNSFFL